MQEMDYNIKLDTFEGPLDLLLHLIKKDNISIYDISINKITKDYLNYIQKLKELNIDIASSYLVMASELLLIKSSSLLPRENTIIEEEEEHLTRDSLIQKLVDYEKYKELTIFFKEKEVERQKIYTKPPENIGNYKLENKKNAESIDNLTLAFKEFLEKKNEEKPITTKVTTKEYDINERKREIKKVIISADKVVFTSLFEKENISHMIITFLAILDLIKEGFIDVIQARPFEEIIIERRNK